tara:strand:+ start:324 stop:545 length:222 start_codon:yes stop_codon:yes gene_type:complete
MKNQIKKTGKWAVGYLAAKAGKKVVAKSGVVGLGIGAAAGLGYLGYKLFRKKKEENDISENYHEIKGEKKIVV